MVKSVNQFRQRSLWALSAALLLTVSVTGCRVEKTEEGELPALDVDVQADPGQLPAYDVDGPEINLGTTETTVDVPKVDVTTEEKTLEVPTIDIDLPDGDDSTP